MITDSPLPYTDTKPQGAPDFYFVINATFRFVRQQCGDEGLVRYWTDLGREYLRPVWELWAREGVPGVARYWRAFFDAEPGSEVDVVSSPAEVILHVRKCPLIAHLRAGGREIEPSICQHCYYISESAGRQAGFEVRVEGGAGSCVQHFYKGGENVPPQKLEDIRRC